MAKGKNKYPALSEIWANHINYDLERLNEVPKGLRKWVKMFIEDHPEKAKEVDNTVAE